MKHLPWALHHPPIFATQRPKRVVAKDPDDPSWISFTSSEAPWVPMSVDPEMQKTYDEREAIIRGGANPGPESEKAADVWVSRAEQALHTWIVKGILMSEKRAAHFRSLGRGWIFIQLSSQHDNPPMRALAHFDAICQHRQVSAVRLKRFRK